jgi:YD repeat-containing protein
LPFYTTSGNAITVTEADGTTLTTGYFVSGNTLRVAVDTAAVVAVFQKH